MPTPPLPDKLDRSCDKWKSPVQGYRNRDPLAVYYLYVQLNRAPDHAQLRPWLLLKQLRNMFGDHRITLASFNRSGEVHRTGLPWRSREYTEDLEVPLSWLCQAMHWDALVPIFKSTWWIQAHRGGGATRHRVWQLSCEPPHSDGSRSNVELELQTRHVPGRVLTALPPLIDRFYRSAAAAGATYGNGGVFREVLNRWPRYTLDGVFGYLWRDYPRNKNVVVPWVYAVNFFDAARTRQMGDPPPSNTYGRRCITLPIGAGCLIRPKVIDAYEVSEDRRQYLPDVPDCDNVDLLGRLIGAKMLVVQHMDVLYEQSKRREAEYQRRRSLQKKQARQPRSSIKSWLTALRTKPPRFLQGRSEPDLSDLSRALAEHIHPRTTRFLIRRPGDPRPLAVFGASSRDTTTLHGPLLFGSAKRERAAAAFDPAKDGYDGELAGADADNTPRRLKQFACPRCDGRAFDLRAALEYPDDLDELEESHRSRAEDFFTWLWIIGRCPACAWEGVIADHECA